MRQKHSPLLWKVGEGTMLNDTIYDKYGIPVTYCSSEKISIRANRANAQFIVQACNNFEELLEVCKKAVFVIKSNPVIESYIGQLKTAIAKAEAKGGDA